MIGEPLFYFRGIGLTLDVRGSKVYEQVVREGGMKILLQLWSF